MRIDTLDLIAFGPFTEQSIVLTPKKSDLHVVYGPNEAGKTAALRAITSLLFGYPPSVEDAFVHKSSKLRVGATLSNSKKKKLRFARKRGRKDAMFDPLTGKPYPYEALGPYLGELDEETFTKIYAIDYGNLVDGGNTLQGLKGLLDDSLFAAGLGGPRLQAVLYELEQDCDVLYERSKQKREITLAIGGYKNAVEGRKEAAASESEWRTAISRQQEVEEQRRGLQAELDGMQSRERRINRLLQARRVVVARKRAAATLAELGEVVTLPKAYSKKDREKWQAKLAKAVGNIERITDELDGPSGIRASLAAIELPQELLAQAGAITDLSQRVEDYRNGKRDLEKTLMPDRTNLCKERSRLFADCELEAGSDDIESLEGHRVAPSRKAAVSALANEEGQLRGEPKALGETLSKLKTKAERLEATLAALGEPKDARGLKSAVEAARKAGDIDGRLEEARAEADEQSRSARAALERLVLGSVGIDGVDGLGVPSKATVGRFEDEYREQQLQRNRNADRLREAEQNKADAERSLERMSAEREIATLEDLAGARRHRDDGWRLVRSAWLDEADDPDKVREFAGGEEPLPEAYEKSVTRADDVADTLRTDADRVAEAHQLRARVREADATVALLKEESTGLDERARKLDDEWHLEWQAVGITDPKPPKEMREWCDSFAEARAKVEEIRRSSAEMGRLEAERGELRASLVHAAKDIDGTDIAAVTDAGDEKLAPVLTRAVDVLDAADKASRDRLAVEQEMPSVQDEIATASQKLVAAQSALERWQKQWTEAAQAVGCSPSASAAEVQQKIASLDGLFATQAELTKLEGRIAGIEERAGTFSADMAKLVTTVAVDLADATPDAAAVELGKRLEAAQKAQTKAEGLREQEDKALASMHKAQADKKEMETHLRGLCDLAGVEEIAELAEAEARSEEYTKARKEQEDSEDELLKLFGPEQFEQSTAEAEASDPEELEKELSSIGNSVKSAQAELSKLDKESGDLERQLDGYDGTQTAADADQEALECLAEANRKTQVYVRLRLASALLRLHMDRHGSEDEIPMLSRASELFARITCGAFESLETELTDAGLKYVIAVRPDEEALGVEEMSEGTRDQLFLALRLAYIESRLGRQEVEPVPFIVDDILVSFDDDRARATLEVLAEFSALTQVIFFTHHRHLAEIASDLVKSGRLAFHELPNRFAEVDE